jgi:chemotaxis protein methyltransferase CheR
MLDTTSNREVDSREYTFSGQDFERVRRLIHRRAGISLNSSKNNMVYSRLSRRLRATGHTSFKAYLDHLESAETSEWQEFTNSLTTNLTSFFRESHHFPILADYLRAQSQRPVRIWCSAASTGEEPYTLAITAAEAFGSLTPPVEIVATDIDTNVLATAAAGVYPIDGLRGISEEQRKKYFLKGSGTNAGRCRVRPELSRLITFAPLNLLDADYHVQGMFDVAFCRNVLIYFDKPTQHAVLDRIGAKLKIGGLLFAGHSENFSDCKEKFRLRGKTVYERIDGPLAEHQSAVRKRTVGV